MLSPALEVNDERFKNLLEQALHHMADLQDIARVMTRAFERNVQKDLMEIRSASDETADGLRIVHRGIQSMQHTIEANVQTIIDAKHANVAKQINMKHDQTTRQIEEKHDGVTEQIKKYVEVTKQVTAKYSADVAKLDNRIDKNHRDVTKVIGHE
jgi:flagellar hook-basal body complex protein FliE